MARPAADGIRAKIPSYAAPASVCLGGGSMGSRGKRQRDASTWGRGDCVWVGFLMSYGIPDCHAAPQVFASESRLCHTHSGVPLHRWESQVERKTQVGTST